MPRRIALTILCLVLGSYWTLVLSAPPLSGEEQQSPTETATPSQTAALTAPEANPAPATPPAEDEPEAQTWTLQYKFLPGQTIHYESTHEMEITTRYDGTSEIAKNKSEYRKHYHVLSVNEEGIAEIQTVIDWVRMMAKFGEDGPEQRFDSDKPEEASSRFEQVKAAVGKPQPTMAVSPSGECLISARSDAGAKEAIQGFLIRLPEKPVTIGDSWKEDNYEVKVTVENNLTQSILLTRHYRLESVENGMATISMKTAVLTPVNNPKISAQLIQREISGKIVFDIEHGLIASRQYDVDKAVIGAFGPKTAMQAVSRLVEQRTNVPATADRAPGKTSGTETK